MMTVPMDGSLDNSSKERVQRLYNKNLELESKRRKAAQARVPSDPTAWQQMRENYETIILEDHAFSEQHEIEYALWQLHYRRIDELRAHFNAAVAAAGSNAPQNGKGPTRGGPDRITKIRTQFRTFLSEATGFYHDLMLKIRAKYGLPLAYFSDGPGSQIPLSRDGNKSAEVKKGLVSCHRCLIYLGDLARYKGLYGDGDSKARDFAAASSYYMQASSLWPSSGNPHHQLAILASYSGDELLAIYRYFRSLAVDNPFSTARENLTIAFEKNRQSFSQLLGDANGPAVKPAPVRHAGKIRGKGEARFPPKENKAEAVSVKDKKGSIPEIFKTFNIRFVRLNGILYTRTSLETFGEVLSSVRNDLLDLLPSGTDEEYTFGSDAAECRLAVVRLVAILIFTVHNVNREVESQSYAEILQRSVLLQNAFTAIFEFMGHVVERCSQLYDPSVSYLLPGVMVFMEWLACHNDIATGSELEEKQANARSFFWNQCIAFFNKLLSTGSMLFEKDEDESCFFNMSRYDEEETANRLALDEDYELRGFLPLVPAQLILDFSRKHALGSDGAMKEKKARVERIIAAGKALANVVKVGNDGIYFDVKMKKFVIGEEPQMLDASVPDSFVEMPKSGFMEENNYISAEISLGELDPKPDFYLEEDEDEVIVFKPSVTDKHVDSIAPNMSSSEAITPLNLADMDLGIKTGPFSASSDSFEAQNVLISSSRPPTPVINSSAPYLQPIQSSASKWQVEHGSIVNGMGSLSLVENGLSSISQMLHQSNSIQPSAFSGPFHSSVNFGMGNPFPTQIPDVAVSSLFTSVMSPPLDLVPDNTTVKPSSVVPAGLKKNPVSRPIRHRGPPPGFGSVPVKAFDEPLPTMTSKNEMPLNPQIDDYSWLDGYQLPLANPSVGYSTSSTHAGKSYLPVSKTSSSVGTVSFPFPGKQILPMQAQRENHRDWQDYQFSEELKMLQEQQHQLQSGNQQPTSLPQQYQGQSLWEGRYFV